MEPQNPTKPYKLSHLIGESYNFALTQAIRSFVDCFHKPSIDFSNFTAAFDELLHSRADPPLETIWFSSALAFLDSNLPKDEPLNRLSATKDLFRFIAACSASCGGSSKSIVLIAPVIYNLHKVVVNLRVQELGLQREKKALKVIKSFVNEILGHLNVCCCNGDDMGAGLDGLILPVKDLVCVWIGDEVEKNKEAKEGLKLFFPLLNDGIIERLDIDGCSVAELAGAVMAEAFLLRLGLDFQAGIGRPNLQSELGSWAVCSMTAFQNVYFFDTLVRMLLEPTPPLTSLMTSAEGNFLKRLLYDVVVLVDYSFLKHENLYRLPAKFVRSLAIKRLVIVQEAVELLREHGDHSKAVSHVKAFSTSHLSRQLIKLIKSDIGVDYKTTEPNKSSPKAFLKWLLSLENQGIKLFDGSLSNYCEKLVLDSSKEDYMQSAHKMDGEKLDTDLLYYIDNKGQDEDEDEDEENENKTKSISATFVDAAHSMQSVDNGGLRKRKEVEHAGRRQEKFLRNKLYENSISLAERSTASREDDSSSESEVGDPNS